MVMYGGAAGPAWTMPGSVCAEIRFVSSNMLTLCFTNYILHLLCVLSGTEGGTSSMALRAPPVRRVAGWR